MNPAECYFCTRHPRLGHHGGCPVLEMTPARALAFFGSFSVGARPTPAPPAEEADLPKVDRHRTATAAPVLSAPRGYIMGDGRLV